MYLAMHSRIYNLSSWSFMSEGGHGAVKLTVPGVSLDIFFSDTTNANPVSMEVLTELLHSTKDEDLGVLSAEEFEELYREQVARLERRRELRAALKG